MKQELGDYVHGGTKLPNQHPFREYDGVVTSNEGIQARHTIKAESNWKANAILRGIYNQPIYQNCNLSALERRKR